MKRIHIAAAAACLALALSLAACDNSYGVLSSIQKEVASSTDSVFYRASVQNVVRFDDSSGGKYYYATMNAIYRRPVSSGPNSGWELLSAGSVGTDYYCSRIAVAGTYLYAALRNTNTNQTMKGVYRTSDGTTWTEVDSSFSSKDVQALYAAGPSGSEGLFAVTNEGTSSTGSSNLDVPEYHLYYLSGTTFTEITNLGGGTAWIPGVASDGTNYFTGVGSTVYTSTIASLSPTSFASCLTTSGAVTSLASDLSYNRAFAGTDYGYVYGTIDHGSNWTSTAPWGAGSSSGDAAAVKALVYVPTNNRLVAGRNMYDEYTSGFYGYYEVALSDTLSAAFSSSYLGDSSTAALNGGDTTNYDTTTKYLYVNNLYYDSTGQRLFIAGRQIISKKLSGLWSDKWDGSSSWGGWTTE